METTERKGGHVENTKGGLITKPLIFANEVCEKLAVVGFGTNMISYLTTTFAINQSGQHPHLLRWDCKLDTLARSLHCRCLCRAILDHRSCIHSTSNCKWRPPPCKGEQVCQQASSGQLAIPYVSLLWTAIGAGSFRHCVVAFGTDQFNEMDPKQKTKTWRFFNWYYFCMGASMLVVVTVIVNV